MDDRLKKQLDFILEADKEKEIIRQTYLSDGSRKETDAEHAWHMALMVMFLNEYANEEVDKYKSICMALVHDIIEIYAGDTYAYDEKGNETKAEREQEACKKLCALLPEDQGEILKSLWEEFEAMETPEAKFVNTLDKVQPLLLNDVSGGKSWAEHGIKIDQVLNRNKKTHEGSEELWSVAKNIIEDNKTKGNLK